MTNGIGAALKTAVGTSVSLYLSEAETESYPYAVYDMTSTEFADKDGRVYKIVGDISLDVVAKDFETANTKMGLVETSLSSLASGYKAGDKFELTSGCYEGIWVLSAKFKIVQFS